jgi:hypothetical protein
MAEKKTRSRGKKRLEKIRLPMPFDRAIEGLLAVKPKKSKKKKKK